MRIVIIANGEPPTQADLDRWLQANDMLICADGGAKAALRFGLRPQHAIGDFDSVSDADLRQLEALGTQLHRHPPAKDETDLELALTLAAQLAANEIIVLGAMGGRIDHELANMLLLAMPALQGCRVIIAHGADAISLLDARRGPHQITLQGHAGDVVSLIPFGGDALGVRTTGLLYPLHNEPLLFGPARGVSNVLLGHSATVRVQSGMLLCIHNCSERLKRSEQSL